MCTYDKNYRPLHALSVGKPAKSAVYQILVYTVFYTILRYRIHLIMFTYLALLISYVYTVFYTILLYLSLFHSDITRPYVYSLNSFLLRFVCIGYMLCILLDITC